MATYKANTKADLNAILIGAGIILAIVVTFSGNVLKTSWMAIGPVLLIWIIYSLWVISLREVQIDKKHQKLLLIYQNYFGRRKIKAFDISAIEFTYKRIIPRFRSPLVDVCTIYNANKEVARIVPDEDGWEHEEIFDLVQELIELGVKNKFVGFGTKDAPV